MGGCDVGCGVIGEGPLRRVCSASMRSGGSLCINYPTWVCFPLRVSAVSRYAVSRFSLSRPGALG
eukprot:222539-Rhodomonas_salina.1